MNYYNEFDPFAAEWLRQLIKAGHIAYGVVDERSIEDVTPEELEGFTQCHFFAGIGVWSHSLRLAGWPDDKPVWTGSCPCQPFSAAGKGAGFDDERHLWPTFYHLIEQCRPSVVFGEQVASKATEPWIDLVQVDLEAMDYTFGCVPFPSAGVGAPHIRDRAYWVADTRGARSETRLPEKERRHERESVLANDRGCELFSPGLGPEAGGACGLADAGNRAGQQSEPGATERGLPAAAQRNETVRPGPTNGLWRDADWLHCRDGKWRPVRPGTFPLVNGASARVGRLRGYGNAINAQAAKEFIGAYLNV